ncbi:MAG TPA: hypothetical protein GXZ90_04550 [Clostridiales bacterium]|nr:hypothetical protein [Clostridiales bacterium]
MNNKDNLYEVKQVFKVDWVHVLLLLMTLMLVINNYNNNKKMKELMRRVEIIQSQSIDYERIETMIDNSQRKLVDNHDNVNYDDIEALIKDNQDQSEKDFGEKFEEATDYFGNKFKGFVKDINDKLNDE